MWSVARLLILPIIVTSLLLSAFSLEAADPLPENWKLYEKRYPSISLNKLEVAIKESEITLIDANATETYHSGHIPGALSLDQLIAVEKQNGMPKDKKSLIVVYCGGPKCTAWHKAADFAHRKGYKNIKHFKGGLKEWVEKGRELEMTM